MGKGRPPLTEWLRLDGTFPIEVPCSEPLSLWRREYYDVFSTRLDLESDLVNPVGPAVNWAWSSSLKSLKHGCLRHWEAVNRSSALYVSIFSMRSWVSELTCGISLAIPTNFLDANSNFIWVAFFWNLSKSSCGGHQAFWRSIPSCWDVFCEWRLIIKASATSKISKFNGVSGK